MSANLFNIHFADLEGLVNPDFWDEFVVREAQKGQLQLISNSLYRFSDELTQLLHSRGRSESVFIGLAQSAAINGCCALVKDKNYLVAINVGVVLRIRLISQILYEVDSGNSDLFTYHDRDWIYHIFGYEVNEKDSTKIEKISDAEKELDLLLQAARKIKERLKHSKFLVPSFTELSATLSLAFIILHELHHVAFGHLARNNPNSQMYSRLWESGVNIQQEHYKFYQGIESCADYGAGKVAGLGFCDRSMFFSRYPLSVTDEVYCRFLSFSMKLSLSIIAFEVSYLDNKHQFNTHPHPELRIFSFFDGVQDGISEVYPNVDSNWQDGIAQGYWAITNAFQKLRILEPIAWSWTSNLQAWDNKFFLSKSVQTELENMSQNRFLAWKSCEAYHLPFMTGTRTLVNSVLTKHSHVATEDV